MKKLLLIFTLLFSVMFSFSSSAEYFSCKVNRYDGSIGTNYFNRDYNKFLFESEDIDLIFNILYEDNNYLYLNWSREHYNINIGIDKNSGRLFMDSMDFKINRPTSRAKGICDFN